MPEVIPITNVIGKIPPFVEPKTLISVINTRNIAHTGCGPVISPFRGTRPRPLSIHAGTAIKEAALAAR